MSGTGAGERERVSAGVAALTHAMGLCDRPRETPLETGRATRLAPSDTSPALPWGACTSGPAGDNPGGVPDLLRDLLGVRRSPPLSPSDSSHALGISASAAATGRVHGAMKMPRTGMHGRSLRLPIVPSPSEVLVTLGLPLRDSPSCPTRGLPRDPHGLPYAALLRAALGAGLPWVGLVVYLLAYRRL
jgi:hypothetical protein